MALQKVINGSLVEGVVGEFSDDSPKSARQFLTVGKDGKGGEFGKFFTIKNGTITGTTGTFDYAEQGVAEGKMLGILVNPKEHYAAGLEGGFKAAKSLAKSGISATIATRGHILVLTKFAVTAGTPVMVDEDGEFVATGGTVVKGAYWLKTVAEVKKVLTPNAEAVAVDVIKEIAIDNPELTAAEAEAQSEDPEGTL